MRIIQQTQSSFFIKGGASAILIFACSLANADTWWAPAGRACPTYNSKEDCEAATKKICTLRSGTARAACHNIQPPMELSQSSSEYLIAPMRLAEVHNKYIQFSK